MLRKTVEWTCKISNKLIQFVQMCIEKNVNQKKVENSFIVQVSLTYMRRNSYRYIQRLSKLPKYFHLLNLLKQYLQ